jgi:hypothetical protein
MAQTELSTLDHRAGLIEPIGPSRIIFDYLQEEKGIRLILSISLSQE